MAGITALGGGGGAGGTVDVTARTQAATALAAAKSIKEDADTAKSNEDVVWGENKIWQANKNTTVPNPATDGNFAASPDWDEFKGTAPTADPEIFVSTVALAGASPTGAVRGYLTVAPYTEYNVVGGNWSAVPAASTAPPLTTVRDTATATNDGPVGEKALRDELDAKQAALPTDLNLGHLRLNAAGTAYELVAVSPDSRTYTPAQRGNSTGGVAPTAGETPDLPSIATAVILLSNGVTEYWSYNGAWSLAFSVAPAGLDGNRSNISRANATTGVAPTALEVVDPIDGDTAIVFLNDGVREYWSHNGTAWALNVTVPASVTMVGATDLLAGAGGTTTAPQAGDQGKFWRGDGTWADVDTSTYTPLTANTALEAGKHYALEGFTASMPSHTANLWKRIKVWNNSTIVDGAVVTITGTFISALNDGSVRPVTDIPAWSVDEFIATPNGWASAWDNTDITLALTSAQSGNSLRLSTKNLINADANAVFKLPARVVGMVEVCRSCLSLSASTLTIEQDDTGATAAIILEDGTDATSFQIDEVGETIGFIAVGGKWEIVKAPAQPTKIDLWPLTDGSAQGLTPWYEDANIAFNLSKYVADKRIKSGTLMMLTNLSIGGGMSIKLDGTKTLNMKRGTGGPAAVPNSAGFSLRPNEQAHVSINDTFVSVSIAPNRDRGYYATTAIMKALPSNSMATGEFAHVGTRTFVYDAVNTDAESADIIHLNDRAASGAFVSASLLKGPNTQWQATSSAFDGSDYAAGDIFATERNLDGKRFLFEIPAAWVSGTTNTGAVFDQAEEDRYIPLSEDGREDTHAIVAHSMHEGAVLFPAGVPVGEYLFSTSGTPSVYASVDAAGAFTAVDRSTFVNGMTLDVKSNGTRWAWDKATNQFNAAVVDTALVRWSQGETITEPDQTRIFLMPADVTDTDTYEPNTDYDIIYKGALPYTPAGGIATQAQLTARLAEGWVIFGPNVAAGNHPLQVLRVSDTFNPQVFVDQIGKAGNFYYEMGATSLNKNLSMAGLTAPTEIKDGAAVLITDLNYVLEAGKSYRTWLLGTQFFIKEEGSKGLYRGILPTVAALTALPVADLKSGLSYSLSETSAFYFWDATVTSGIYEPDDKANKGVDAGWWTSQINKLPFQRGLLLPGATSGTITNAPTDVVSRNMQRVLARLTVTSGGAANSTHYNAGSLADIDYSFAKAAGKTGIVVIGFRDNSNSFVSGITYYIDLADGKITDITQSAGFPRAPSTVPAYAIGDTLTDDVETWLMQGAWAEVDPSTTSFLVNLVTGNGMGAGEFVDYGLRINSIGAGGLPNQLLPQFGLTINGVEQRDTLLGGGPNTTGHTLYEADDNNPNTEIDTVTLDSGGGSVMLYDRARKQIRVQSAGAQQAVTVTYRAAGEFALVQTKLTPQSGVEDATQVALGSVNTGNGKFVSLVIPVGEIILSATFFKAGTTDAAAGKFTRTSSTSGVIEGVTENVDIEFVSSLTLAPELQLVEKSLNWSGSATGAYVKTNAATFAESAEIQGVPGAKITAITSTHAYNPPSNNNPVTVSLRVVDVNGDDLTPSATSDGNSAILPGTHHFAGIRGAIQSQFSTGAVVPADGKFHLRLYTNSATIMTGENINGLVSMVSTVAIAAVDRIHAPRALEVLGAGVEVRADTPTRVDATHATIYTNVPTMIKLTLPAGHVVDTFAPSADVDVILVNDRTKGEATFLASVTGGAPVLNITTVASAAQTDFHFHQKNVPLYCDNVWRARAIPGLSDGVSIAAADASNHYRVIEEGWYSYSSTQRTSEGSGLSTGASFQLYQGIGGWQNRDGTDTTSSTAGNKILFRTSGMVYFRVGDYFRYLTRVHNNGGNAYPGNRSHDITFTKWHV